MKNKRHAENGRPGSLQLHAGDHSKQPGKKLWHTYPNGNYWCGSWHERTPQQLLDECRSTIKDLKRIHPELDARPLRSNDEAEAAAKRYAAHLPNGELSARASKT